MPPALTCDIHATLICAIHTNMCHLRPRRRELLGAFDKLYRLRRRGLEITSIASRRVIEGTDEIESNEQEGSATLLLPLTPPLPPHSSTPPSFLHSPLPNTPNRRDNRNLHPLPPLPPLHPRSSPRAFQVNLRNNLARCRPNGDLWVPQLHQHLMAKVHQGAVLKGP